MWHLDIAQPNVLQLLSNNIILFYYKSHDSTIKIISNRKNSSSSNFKSIIDEELLKVARSSDNKKEAQNGFIPARLLQCTEKDYLRYLLAIINHCISNNTFPSKLKLGENKIKFESLIFFLRFSNFDKIITRCKLKIIDDNEKILFKQKISIFSKE